MKRLIMGAYLFLVGGIAFGQNKSAIDPSYSTNNYKHSNKAAYARKHKLDKSIKLTQVFDWSGAEHKHRYNQTGLVMRASFKTKKVNAARGGYKHSLGL